LVCTEPNLGADSGFFKLNTTEIPTGVRGSKILNIEEREIDETSIEAARCVWFTPDASESLISSSVCICYSFV
jgi:hypothetical protein